MLKNWVFVMIKTDDRSVGVIMIIHHGTPISVTGNREQIEQSEQMSYDRFNMNICLLIISKNYLHSETHIISTSAGRTYG